MSGKQGVILLIQIVDMGIVKVALCRELEYTAVQRKILPAVIHSDIKYCWATRRNWDSGQKLPWEGNLGGVHERCTKPYTP